MLVGQALRARSGVLLALFLLGATFIAGFALGVPTSAMWAWFGVDHEGLAFPDLTIVTHALGCVSRGIDPYVTTACDPWGRIYNYPPITLLLSHLGIREWHTVKLGLALDIAFCAVLGAILTARTWVGHLVMFLAVLSYPVLWAIERGNVDLAILIGCVAVCLVARGRSLSPYRNCAAGLMVATMFVAKLYPIVALTALWRDRRTALASIAVAALVLGGYLAAYPGTLKAVRELTPFMTERSYGAGVLVGHLYLRATDSSTAVLPDSVRLTSYLVSALALLVATVIALRAHRRIGRLLQFPPGLEFRLAVVGVSIYCLTYCLGTNFNYRLVFLVLSIPLFVSRWESTRDRHWLLLAILVLGLLWSKWQVHYGWDYRPRETLPLLAELLAFALFLAFSTALIGYMIVMIKRRSEGAVAQRLEGDRPNVGGQLADHRSTPGV